MIDIKEAREITNTRMALLKKASAGVKLTDEERYWLVTNPSVYSVYDDVVFYEDIIDLEPKKNYSVKISYHSYSTEDDMFPVFGITKGTGGIKIPPEELPPDANKNKRIKYAAIHVYPHYPEFNFEYMSSIGQMKVNYRCEYYDTRVRLHKNEGSTMLRMLGQNSGNGEGQGGLACCSPWDHKESDLTWQLNNEQQH